MKGKNLKQLLNNQKAKRVGCILLAAAVLGTGAWAVDNGQKSDVPELTSFVDLDDQISIDEDEVPLTSAPKTSVKTQTSTTKKVVNLKKKSTKTYTQKSKPKSVKSPTITKTSRAATTTTNRVTTTYVTKRYKKNSKKMTMITTKKIKTTITTVQRPPQTPVEPRQHQFRKQQRQPLLQRRTPPRTTFPLLPWLLFLTPES